MSCAKVRSSIEFGKGRIERTLRLQIEIPLPCGCHPRASRDGDSSGFEHTSARACVLAHEKDETRASVDRSVLRGTRGSDASTVGSFERERNVVGFDDTSLFSECWKEAPRAKSEYETQVKLESGVDGELTQRQANCGGGIPLDQPYRVESVQEILAIEDNEDLDESARTSNPTENIKNEIHDDGDQHADCTPHGHSDSVRYPYLGAQQPQCFMEVLPVGIKDEIDLQSSATAPYDDDACPRLDAVAERAELRSTGLEFSPESQNMERSMSKGRASGSMNCAISDALVPKRRLRFKTSLQRQSSPLLDATRSSKLGDPCHADAKVSGNMIKSSSMCAGEQGDDTGEDHSVAAWHLLRPPLFGHRVVVIGGGWGGSEPMINGFCSGYEAIVTEADMRTYTVVATSGTNVWQETHVLQKYCVPVACTQQSAASSSRKGESRDQTIAAPGKRKIVEQLRQNFVTGKACKRTMRQARR
eukprot:TRINITY_DN39822_c0_g1_i1.p1 TRINITY_DN39822_c0_g1~~TRINITY_DN39822_c0_g1_i1.p1  ORF type:complete len:474 (-),score=37.90 TRINITY_DN39822_c0_g1_i1:142-1563(-)